MMNQEDIFKKVGQIFNELQDQYEFLAQNPESAQRVRAGALSGKCKLFIRSCSDCKKNQQQ